MSIEPRRCRAHPRRSLVAALMLLSVVAPGLSQVSVETHLRSDRASLVRLSDAWRLSPLMSVDAEVEGVQNAALSRAVIAVGGLESHGWIVEAGRQRLSHGDERLLASNRDTGSVNPVWDAVRSRFAQGPVTAEAFFARSSVHAVSLGGLIISAHPSNGHVLEAYCFRKSRLNARGLRADGTAFGFKYNVEFTLEPGRRRAGHWELRHAIHSSKIGAEYNHASPGFDEFFPAALNRYGTEDPFPWSDTRNVAAAWEWDLPHRLQLGFSYRSYWSASGDYLAQHVVAGTAYEAKTWRLAAGCGRLLAARLSDAPQWTPFISLSRRF